MIITERDGMRKTAKKSRARVITDTGIFCVAVIFMFFSVVLFVQEFDYVPQEVYNDPPPSAPKSENTPSDTPVVNPVPSSTPYMFPIPSASPLQSAGSTPLPSPTGNTETATPKPTASSTPKPTDRIFGEDELHPVKLYFIEQRISCNIRPVGINAKYEMGTIRSPYDAGWLYEEPYVLPGDMGKAVIAGHNRWNGHNGTFSVLKKMQAGETVAVEMSDGYARYFRVDEITECAYNDNTIMEPIYDKPVLILITCKGDWDSVLHTSRTRVIAICSPIEN